MKTRRPSSLNHDEFSEDELDSDEDEDEEDHMRDDALKNIQNDFGEKYSSIPDIELSDDTKISGTTWFELKSKAMEPGYIETSPFVKLLNKSEREILLAAIEAQNE